MLTTKEERFSVYDTHTLLLNKKRTVDAKLDASDNATSGNEPPPQMLTSQSQKPESRIWRKFVQFFRARFFKILSVNI